eukprot:751470-Pyramimonas_sp.AAC.1
MTFVVGWLASSCRSLRATTLLSVLCFSPFTPSSEFPAIPKRTCKHPEFAVHLEQLIAELDRDCPYTTALERLRSIKSLMFITICSGIYQDDPCHCARVEAPLCHASL